jgi:hypothetical protein
LKEAGSALENWTEALARIGNGDYADEKLGSLLTGIIEWQELYGNKDALQRHINMLEGELSEEAHNYIVWAKSELSLAEEDLQNHKRCMSQDIDDNKEEGFDFDRVVKEMSEGRRERFRFAITCNGNNIQERICILTSLLGELEGGGPSGLQGNN